MPRSEARLQVDLWREGLNGLSAHGKLLYCVLLTEPTLNHAGVAATRFSRWARNASLTAAELEKSISELVDSGHIVADDDTEEILVRTFIRRDGVADQPNLLKSALAAARAVKSPLLRWVLAEELRKLPPQPPDGVSRSGRPFSYPDPHAAADELAPPGTPPPSDMASPAHPDAVPNPSGTLPEPFSNPSSIHPNAKGSGTHREPPGVGVGVGEGGNCSVATPVEEQISSSATASPPADKARGDVEGLCLLLADKIAENGSKRPAITKAWRDAARLMLDKDGRDEAKARRLIEWCQADSFWKTNIMSMPKFRDQYDRLRLRATQEWERNSNGLAVVGGVNGSPTTPRRGTASTRAQAFLDLQRGDSA